MNTELKTALVGISFLALGIVSGYFMFHSRLVGSIATASPVGTTNNSPRVCQVVSNLAATTTVFSCLNSDTADRIIESVNVFASGYGNSSLANINMATSTGNSSSTGASVFATTFSTSTDPVYLTISSATSSSSGGLISPITSTGVRVWAAGTYLNAVVNSTSSGYMTVKVSYIPE